MLGDAASKVSLYSANGQFIADLTRYMQSGKYGRTQSRTSTFTGNFTSDFDSKFNNIDYWSTYILCERDDLDQWYGPVTNFTETDGVYDVVASDVTAYWSRGFAPTVTYTQVDIISIVEDLLFKIFGDHVYAYPVIDSEISGVLATRAYQELDYKSLVDIVTDLQNLTYFAYGKTVYLRGSDSQTFASFSVNDASWSPLPSIEKAGNEYANRVVVKGTGVVGVAEAPQDEVDYYGLLARRFDVPDIVTENGAQISADQKLSQTRDAVRINVDNLATLTREVPITLDELLPGMLVDVDHSVASQSLQRRFLLDSVEVDCMPKDGSGVSIGLVPLKTLED